MNGRRISTKMLGGAMDAGRLWRVVRIVAGILAFAGGLALVFVTFGGALIVLGFATPGVDLTWVYWLLAASTFALANSVLNVVGLVGKHPEFAFPLAAAGFAVAAVLSIAARPGPPIVDTLTLGAGLLALITPWWRPR